jgi:hypothetical protein
VNISGSLKKTIIHNIDMAYRNGFYKEICEKFNLKDTIKLKWDIETCLKESLKYCTISQMIKSNPTLYNSIRKFNILNEVKKHMIEMKKPIEYWTIDICRNYAILCKSRTEFQKKYQNVYNKSVKLGFLDEICSHMEIKGNLKKRLVYVYEFSDNHCYVVLTFNFKQRNDSHMKLIGKKISSVGKHIIKTNLVPTHKFLTDYIFIEEAKRIEKEKIVEYRDNGWILLNMSKGGEVGSNLQKNSYDVCKLEALKFTTKSEFRKNSTSCYVTALKNKWLDDICGHMIVNRIKWDVELCVKKSKEYTTVSKFNKSRAGYAAKRLGISEELKKNMIKLREANNTLNYEYCKKVSFNFKTKRELYLNNESVYLKCRKNGRLEEFFADSGYKPKGYWTKDKCKELALTFATKTEFKKAHPSPHQISYKNSWLDEFFPKK